MTSAPLRLTCIGTEVRAVAEAPATLASIRYAIPVIFALMQGRHSITNFYRP
jgi:hypothetical protein